MPGLYTIEFFVDEAGRSPVEDWMESKLDDIELAALLAGLEHVLGARGLDVCRSEWGKQLGRGLFEFRIRHTAAEIERMFTGAESVASPRTGKVLLRVFCHAYGEKVVLLLNGYDKGRSPSERRQQREIEVARARLREFQQRR